MQIDWSAPFQLAWQLGLFLFGSLLVLFVVVIAFIIGYSMIKAAVTALRSATKKREVEERAKKAAEGKDHPVFLLKPEK